MRLAGNIFVVGIMNKRQLLIQRNNVRQLIRMSNRKANVLAWGAGETDAHIQMKLEICKWLKRNNKEFYTEAIFNNGQRADIVNADDGVIYEVLESEELSSIIKKRKTYPLEIITVDANQAFDEKLIL